MKAHIKITVDNNIIDIDDKLISLVLTDSSGMQADSLSVSIDDVQNSIALPRKGVKLNLAIGINNLVDMGSYIVDGIVFSSPADIIEINASSADFTADFLSQRDINYSDSSIAEIVRQVAIRNKLNPKISKKYDSITLKKSHQDNESDINLITRLARDYGAMAGVKHDNLLFYDISSKTNISGSPLPTITIDKSQATTYSYRDQSRIGKITGVYANWNDKKYGKIKKVFVGKVGPSRTLKRSFKNADTAKAAAQAELMRLSQDAKTLQLTLAVGNANIIGESLLRVTGFKDEINNTNWQIKNLTHRIDSSGFTTSINCVEIFS